MCWGGGTMGKKLRGQRQNIVVPVHPVCTPNEKQGCGGWVLKG